MAPKTQKHTTKRKATEALFESFGLPGWLGWGTAGAESTYGTNGNYAFGGIDLPNSGNGNYWVEARESAKAYKGLVQQYGSIPAAIEHYSGGEYGVAHVKQLASGGSSQGGEKVDANFFEEFLGNLPGAGPGLKLGTEAGNAIGVPNPLEEGANALGLDAITQPFITISEVFKVIGEILFTPQGWLRIGKIIGGALFLLWGLERLIAGSSPTKGPVSGIAKDAAVAAIVK